MNGMGTRPELLESEAPLRVATLAADEIAARRIVGVLAEEGFPVTNQASCADAFVQHQGVDLQGVDLLVGAFGRGLTARERQLRTLRGLLEGTTIVAVIPADTRRGVRRALEVGTHGVVFEADLETALGPTVRAVLAGQIAIPAVERGQFERPTLSFREKELLGLIAAGMSNKEISRTLFLAESTVKCHLTSAFVKLGVRSRNEAADLILNEGAELGLADLTPAPAAVGVE
jgi:DNA-binding NarL/FixJ family response regulator